MPGPMVMFVTKWPSMTSRCRTSAPCSTLAISSASFEKSAERSDGASLIMKLPVAGFQLPGKSLNRRRLRALLDDVRLFRLADDEGDGVPPAHWRAAQRKLTNDYAIGDSGIGLELHRRHVQAVGLQSRPDGVERMVDEVGHDVRARRDRDVDQQGDRRLRRDDGAGRRLAGDDAVLRRRVLDIGQISELEVLLAEAQERSAGRLRAEVGNVDD